MKKSLLALTLTAALFSCKKDIEQKTITATDNSGNGFIKGQLMKTIITPNGNGAWTNNTKVPAAGVNITARVATNGGNGIYPSSNYNSTEVFSGTTDANGWYNIAVKSNGTSNGVQAQVFVEGFNGTQDTLINGTTKVGRLCNYFGQSTFTQVYKGQTAFPWNNTFTWSFNNGNMTVVTDINNPTANNLGTAIVTGSVNMSFVRQSITVVSGTPQAAVYSNTNVPVPDGTKVYCTLTNDPLTLSPKVYQVSTTAGTYTFNLNTVNAGTPGFNQNSTIWVSDLVKSRDTVKVTVVMTGTTFVSSSTAAPVAGETGVYDASGLGQNHNSLFSNENRNSINFTYAAGNFQPN